tara:strand:- start:171 stop:398 length:228 start_codon:yes stop_codon:yes gene_type:complete
MNQQTFVAGDIYEWAFTIDGRLIPIRATFTGKGVTVNGVEFGYFENVDTGKKYLLSKEGYAKLQQQEWDDDKVEW